MKKMLIEEHISAFVFAVMVLIAFVNIISRIFSGFSFAFTEELIVYLFVVITMFSAAAGVYRRVHMSLTILADRFKGKGQIFFIMTSSVASVILFGMLAWQSTLVMIKQIRYEYLTAVLQLPQWIFTVSMVLGSLFYIIRTVQVTVIDIRAALKKSSAADEADEAPVTKEEVE